MSAESVEETALNVAGRFAVKPPAAVRNAKAMLKADYINKLDGIITQEIVQLVAMIEGAECKEALSAFAEKRKPDFSQF